MPYAKSCLAGGWAGGGSDNINLRGGGVGRIGRVGGVGRIGRIGGVSGVGGVRG